MYNNPKRNADGASLHNLVSYSEGNVLWLQTDFLQKIAPTDQDTRNIVVPSKPQPCGNLVCKYKQKMFDRTADEKPNLQKKNLKLYRF